MANNGLMTLPRSYTIGSQVETSSSFFAPDLFQLNESTDIYSTTGGNYRSLINADVIFVQSDGPHYRAYDASSNSFNGSITFGIWGGYTYVYTIDINNDGFDDLVTSNLTASSSSAPNSTYITALLSAGNGDLGSLPFPDGYGQEPVSYIGDGSMQISIEGAIIQVSDLAFADFNRDGWLDVVAVGVNVYSTFGVSGTDNEDNDGCYAIGFGNGTGSFNFTNGFQPTGDVFGGINITAGLAAAVTPRVAAGDFDGDGLVDVAMAFHGDDGLPSTTNPPAYIVWGDSNSSSTGLLNIASSNKYSNGWVQPQDVAAVRGQASDTVDQLVIAFNSSMHIARFNSDRTLQQDNEITGLGRGNLGTLLDYDLDGLTDLVSVDGESSTVLLGYDWQGTSGDVIAAPGFFFGTDIQGVAGFDYNGDGKPDLASGDNSDDHLYIYSNETGDNTDVAQITLVERQRVSDSAINGVDARFMTGNGTASYAVSVVGGGAGFDNAFGWYVIGADGRMGEARFIDIDTAANAPVNLGPLAEGSRLGLFLVADGENLNPSFQGSFHFLDTASQARARIGSNAPILVSDSDGSVIQGNIFHTADARPLDVRNPLNSGGYLQALSRFDGSDTLLIGIEDLVLPDGDGDFNDLLLRVTVHDSIF